MYHTNESENALTIFDMALILFNLIIVYFCLKLRPFKNYSSTFHIIAKHVDIYIALGNTKCAISIVIVLLLTGYNKLSWSFFG